jgi:hypothetical protein
MKRPTEGEYPKNATPRSTLQLTGQTRTEIITETKFSTIWNVEIRFRASRGLGSETMKIGVYLICSVLGFVAGFFLPFAWYPYDSILVSYHLYLIWLVISAEHETGFSLPIVSTIFTHLACLTVVVGISYIRHHIPFFGLIRYLIPAMAPFEVTWLFSGEMKKKEAQVTTQATTQATAAAAVPAAAQATADDYELWLRYLAQPNRPTRKPGLSIKDEHEQWLNARAKAKSGNPSSR